jgi:hypothetical protein
MLDPHAPEIGEGDAKRRERGLGHAGIITVCFALSRRLPSRLDRLRLNCECFLLIMAMENAALNALKPYSSQA